MKTKLIVRRHEYEEPYHTQLEFIASNGSFYASTDIYCGVQQIREIGEGLRQFPRKVGDEYRFEYGSEDPKDRYYRYFHLRAYTTDNVGHCAIQIKVNQNTIEPYEGQSTFSIRADAAQINRLGDLFLKLSELKELEFHWSPTEAEMFDVHQRVND